MSVDIAQTMKPGRAAALLAWLCLAAGGAAAQEDVARLNTVLDIDALYEPASAREIHGATVLELLEELQGKHYLPVRVDDGFSSALFDAYIDRLDPSRTIFLGPDIDELSMHRYTLDDAIKAGSIDPAFEIYNRHYRRILERVIYTIRRAENHIPDMDFTRDESVVLDRDAAPYAETREELDEIWRRRVKNSVLNLRLAGDGDEEIREKLSRRYRNQLSQLLKNDERDVFQHFLSTIARTVDPHTDYYSPRSSENFNMQMSLSLEGIGAQLTSEDEYTKIVDLVEGGPAARGRQLKVGDRIIGVGQGPAGEIQDVVGMRLDDVVAQIRGEEGTVVRLSVIPADAVGEASATTVSITRETVKLEDQSARKQVIELEHDGAAWKIGVIELPTFYFDFEAAARGDQDFRSSTRDVRALLEELRRERVDAVVLDLRDNGGGSLSEANQLVGLFIETGPTVQIRYSGARNGYVRSFGDNDPEVAYAGPLAVLVNRISASASEIFAGAIQDYERGIVLGGRTFGKGTVQEIVPLDFGQVKLTRSKFYRVSGASTQHRGVVPDIRFPDPYEAYEDLGESNLDGALPWDTVRPVEHRRYHPVKEQLPALEELHRERAEASPDFVYLEARLERTRELRSRAEQPLNEATARAEQEAARRAEFDADNMRRLLKGLPLREWRDEEDEDGADGDSASTGIPTDDVAAAGAPEEDADEEEDADPLLLESGRILMDFVSLSGARRTAADG